MAPCAQHELRLVLGLFKILHARLHVDDQACVCALDTEENRERGHYEVVLVLAENAADLFHYAYHHEFIVAHANGLPDGVHAEE